MRIAVALLLAVAAAALAILLQPLSPALDLPLPGSAALDAALGLALVLIAWGLQTALPRVPTRVLLGAFTGALLGTLATKLLWLAMPDPGNGTLTPALQGLVFLALLYAGTAVGVSKGRRFRLTSVKELWEGEEPRTAPKVLDTSVIIDGRIHDVIEAGFLDGRLIVPQFVLRELQQVADSADSLKRARGRKGLELLNLIKKIPSVQVEVTQMDFPQVREVDMKLIELARRTNGKIVTNDFNLNKVARVRDIEVLNINELANALKPVVLPGEPMRVFILKEGKEPNQGVAYLDDGTMVVVDDGRSLVGQTVDIVVTSVLQTTAGKMFFGRCEQAAARNGRKDAVS